MIGTADAWPIVRSAAVAFRPPRSIKVSEGAERNLIVRQPGGYSGPWDPSNTPYMVEPMDELAARSREAVVFVGPARSGKTLGLIDGWMAHCAVNDPGDLLIVQMSQEKAREYSKTRVDRAIRHSPALSDLLSPRRHDDNTHDKLLRHGMWIKIGWPSVSQLSSSDYRYVALTDYDRFPADIDGEGAAFALGLKRTQTYLSRGMCLAESSPGWETTDPHWAAASRHEAPPAPGILSIYNASDRRRWYWRCEDCAAWFEAAPGLSLFATLPPESDLAEIVRSEDLAELAATHAIIGCPHCGSLIEHSRKPALNAGGRWLAEGQSFDGDQVVGEIRGNVAGFWLGGVAAAYQSWESILLRYLQGLREYVTTGSEAGLKATTGTDQALPYMPRHLAEAKAGNASHKVEDLRRFFVPPEARFLIAAVDVQGGIRGRFVVQVIAFGRDLEQWVVDRFDITDSPRGQHLRIDPASHPEDWEALTDRVVGSTYRIDAERELEVVGVAVDSGGEAGVTANAYAWYRRLRARGLSQHVRLVKGASTTTERPVWRATPRDHRTNKIQRDLDLWLVATDFFKDAIATYRRRTSPGAGFVHFPSWLPSTFFDELDAEIRGPAGKWKRVRARNESLDLWVYALAYAWILDAHRIDWDRAPAWARPLEHNSMIVSPEQRRAARPQLRRRRGVVRKA